VEECGKDAELECQYGAKELRESDKLGNLHRHMWTPQWMIDTSLAFER
jgi:hypothetical protein